MYRERASTVVEIVDECLYLFQDTIVYDEKAAKKHLRPVVKEPMMRLAEVFDELGEWESASIEVELNKVLEEFDLKMPKLALPLRVALVGTASSPSIGITLELVGKSATLARMAVAQGYIDQRIEQAR